MEREQAQGISPRLHAFPEIRADGFVGAPSCFLGLFSGRGRSRFVTRSVPLMKLCARIIEIARSAAGVLIRGESGTGKELIARALHLYSQRRDRPFIAVNCANLRGELLESELFGHDPGAFTGAVSAKPGVVERADLGTLFLDEVSEMCLTTQGRLLRFLAEREACRIGSTRTRRMDIRVIAATNRDLGVMIREGGFRLDLYHRLHVVPIDLPPLRERKEDIPLLARLFLEELAAENGRPVSMITEGALELMKAQPWLGNVREFRNSLEALLLTTPGGSIGVDPVASHLGGHPFPAAQVSPPQSGIQNPEGDKLREVLERFKWNKSAVARELGISRTTLYKLMRKHGFLKPSDKE